MKAAGCRWVYSFPRLHVVDLGGLADMTEPEAYDPSESVRREIERAKGAKELEELREELDREFEREVRRARERPLPGAVEAHRRVFGRLPEGWPHMEM